MKNYLAGPVQPFNTNEDNTFAQTNDFKKVPLNTRSIRLYDFYDLYGLEGDKSTTSISSNLQIYKDGGKIKEGNEHLKGESSYYSGFLGLMNVMGVNFLVLVKEVVVHFILDGRNKIFEIVSIEFLELVNSQQESKMNKEVQDSLNKIEQLLSGGGFYFSYKYPLTLSQQKIYDYKPTEVRSSQAQPKQPQEPSSQMKLVDLDYLWNYQLMKPLLQQRVSSEWQVQLIQGHLYNLVTYTPSITYYTIISRRQSRRGGTRFNHQGIDSDGYVANCVETEQIVVIPSNNLVLSYVQIRGSVPCFWSQKGISGKVVLESSRPLQVEACKLHLDYLKKNYNMITLINLMSASKTNQKKLTTELKEIIQENNNEEFGYFEFDFADQLSERAENIDNYIIFNLKSIFEKYGCFSRNQFGNVFNRQKGIIRTICFNSLEISNLFQMKVAFIAFTSYIFTQLKLSFQQSVLEKFNKDYLIAWNNNGDYITNHYTAVDNTEQANHNTRTKTGVFGFLKGTLSSAKKFFKGGLIESEKQQCYCVLLGQHLETQENLGFQEELQKELKLRENKFTKKRKVTIFSCTWNVGNFYPEKATQKFPALFWHNQKYDLAVFSFQEIVELKPKNLMMSTNEKHNVQKKWEEALQNNLGKDYFLVKSENMVGIQTYVFALNSLNKRISDIETDTVKCGFGGQLGNKGAVTIRFSIDDSSIVFINCHLPAGHSKVVDRVSALNQCLQQAFQQEGQASYMTEPLLKTDKIIVTGDMNFRIEKKYTETVATIDQIINLKKQFQLEEAQLQLDQQILQYDQLLTITKQFQTSSSSQLEIVTKTTQQQKSLTNNQDQQLARTAGLQACLDSTQLQGKINCLRPFYEKKIRFLPTYKFDPNSDAYDTSKKQRVPSYCDRVLIWDQENDNHFIQDCFLAYESCPSLQQSDHKPVFAVLQFQMKLIDQQARDQVIEEIVALQEEDEFNNSFKEIDNYQSTKIVNEQTDKEAQQWSMVNLSLSNSHKGTPCLPALATGDFDPFDCVLNDREESNFQILINNDPSTVRNAGFNNNQKEIVKLQSLKYSWNKPEKVKLEEDDILLSGSQEDISDQFLPFIQTIKNSKSQKQQQLPDLLVNESSIEKSEFTNGESFAQSTDRPQLPYQHSKTHHERNSFIQNNFRNLYFTDQQNNKNDQENDESSNNSHNHDNYSNHDNNNNNNNNNNTCIRHKSQSKTYCDLDKTYPANDLSNNFNSEVEYDSIFIIPPKTLYTASKNIIQNEQK